MRESGSQLSTAGKPWRPRAHVDRGPGTSPGVACHAGRVRRVCKAKIGSLRPKGLPDDNPPVSYLPLIIRKAQELVDGFGDRNLQTCDDRSVADDPTSAHVGTRPCRRQRLLVAALPTISVCGERPLS